MLSKIKNTSPGYDGIPSWFYKSFSTEMSHVICKIINVSVACGFVPNAWKHAVVTPVPKCHPVTCAGDFRPISVTSLLCRLTEKLVVRNYVQPTFKNLDITDQYAYKPTGSTTAALIDITHQTSLYLENHDYVRCVLIDFSKAFDTVNHSILIEKLKSLKLPTFIHGWILNFLTDRKQSTKFNGELSLYSIITRSIVQGSGVGPSLFLIYIADLKTQGKDNRLIKFADDCTLLVPAGSSVSVECEMKSIKEWAILNKMMLNLGKTKEIVFHRPHPRKFSLPPKLTDIEQVSSAKLLGVYFTDQLSMTEHLNKTVAVCNQRLYLLCQLKKQDMSVSCLHIVFDSIVICKILYASPAWFGYVNNDNVNLIQKLLSKAFRWGLSGKRYDARDLLSDRDYICSKLHVVHIIVCITYCHLRGTLDMS